MLSPIMGLQVFANLCFKADFFVNAHADPPTVTDDAALAYANTVHLCDNIEAMVEQQVGRISLLFSRLRLESSPRCGSFCGTFRYISLSPLRTNEQPGFALGNPLILAF